MKTTIPYTLNFEIGQIFEDDQPIGFSDITMSAKEAKDFRRRIAKAILDPSPFGVLRYARTMSRGGRNSIERNRWLPPTDPVEIWVVSFKRRHVCLGCGSRGF